MFIHTLDRPLSPMWRHTRVIFFYAEVKMSYKNDARCHCSVYFYFLHIYSLGALTCKLLFKDTLVTCLNICMWYKLERYLDSCGHFLLVLSIDSKVLESIDTICWKNNESYIISILNILFQKILLFGSLNHLLPGNSSPEQSGAWTTEISILK